MDTGGLDARTRALIRVVSDVVTQREDELEIHLRLALNQGWAEDEPIETLLHLSGYIGVPSARRDAGGVPGLRRVRAEGT